LCIEQIAFIPTIPKYFAPTTVERKTVHSDLLMEHRRELLVS